MANLKKDVWDWLEKYGTNMSDVKIRYKDPKEAEDSEVIVAHGKNARWFAFTREGFESYKNGGVKGFESCAESENIAYELPEKYRESEPYVNHKSYRIDEVDGKFKVYDKIRKGYVANVTSGSEMIFNFKRQAEDAIKIWIDDQREKYLVLKKEDVENAFGFTKSVYRVLFDEIFIGYIFPLKFFTGKAKSVSKKADDAWGWTTETLLMSKARGFWNVEKSFKAKEDAERYAYEYGVDKFGEPEGDKQEPVLDENKGGGPIEQSSLNQDTDLKGGKKVYAFQFLKDEFVDAIKRAMERGVFKLVIADEADNNGRIWATLKSADGKVYGAEICPKSWIVPSEGQKAELVRKIANTLHKDSIELALEKRAGQKKNDFKTAISEGLMTAIDAKAIIESEGMEVPKYILDMVVKEVTSVRKKMPEPEIRSAMEDGGGRNVLSTEEYQALSDKIKNEDNGVVGNMKFPCELFVSRRLPLKRISGQQATGNEGSFADTDQAINAILERGLLNDEDVVGYYIRVYDGSAEGYTMHREEIARRIAEMEEEKKTMETDAAVSEVQELFAGTRTALSGKERYSNERVVEVGKEIHRQIMIGDKWLLARVGFHDHVYGQQERDGQNMIFLRFRASGKNYKKGLYMYVYFNEGKDEYIVEGIVAIGSTKKNVGTINGLQAEDLGAAIETITDGEKMQATDLVSKEQRDSADEMKKLGKLLVKMELHFDDSIKYHDTDFRGKQKVGWMYILEAITPPPSPDYYEKQVAAAFEKGQIWDALMSGAIMPKDAVNILELAGIKVPEDYAVGAEVQQRMIDKKAVKMLNYLQELSAEIELEIGEVEEPEEIEFKSAVFELRDMLPKFIKTTTVDLLGGQKSDWMRTREEFFELPSKEVIINGVKYKYMKGKLRNGQNFYESKNDWLPATEVPYRLIKQAKEKFEYMRAIDSGRMTAFDAWYIMQSAGVEVPDTILALMGIDENTPTIIGKVLDLKGEKKEGWMMLKEERRIAVEAIRAKHGDFVLEKLSADEYNAKTKALEDELEGYVFNVVKDARESGAMLDAVQKGKLTALDAVTLIQRNNLEAQSSTSKASMPAILFRMAYEETVRYAQSNNIVAEEKAMRKEQGSFVSLIGDRLNDPKENWMLTFSQFEDKLDDTTETITDGRFSSPALRSNTQIEMKVASVSKEFPKGLKGQVNIRKWIYLDTIAFALGFDMQFVPMVAGVPVNHYLFNGSAYVKAIKEGRMTVQDVKDLIVDEGFVVPDDILEMKDKAPAVGTIIGSNVDLLGETKPPLLMTEDEFCVFTKARILEDAESYDIPQEVKQNIGDTPTFSYRVIGTEYERVGKYASRSLAEKYALIHMEGVIKAMKGEGGDNRMRQDYQKMVGEALDTSYYQDKIRQGRMTAKDAETIIDSAGYPVPNDIVEMAKGKKKDAKGSNESVWTGMEDVTIPFTKADYDRLTQGTSTFDAFYADIYQGRGVSNEYYIHARPKLKINTKANALGIWTGMIGGKARLPEKLMVKAGTKNELADWLIENGYLTASESSIEKDNDAKVMALSILCQPFLNEWAEPMGLYAAETDDGYEIRMQSRGDENPLLEYNVKKEQVKYAGQTISTVEYITTMVSRIKFSSMSVKFQKALIELYTSVFNWVRADEESVSSEIDNAKSKADKLKSLGALCQIFVKEWSKTTTIKSELTASRYIISIIDRGKKKYILEYDLDSGEIRYNGMLLTNVNYIKPLVNTQFGGGYNPKFVKALEKFYLDVWNWNEWAKEQDKKEVSDIRSNLNSDVYKTIVMNSQTFVKQHEKVFRAKYEATGSVFVVTVSPSFDTSRKQAAILWYNTKSGTVLIGGKVLKDMTDIEIYRFVETEFSRYGEAFQKSLVAYYKSILAVVTGKSQSDTKLSAPRDFSAREMNMLFEDFFIRNDGRFKADKISKFADKLDDNEKAAFLIRWRDYMSKNNVTLDPPYYINPRIANREEDGIQTQVLSKAKELKYLRSAIMDEAPEGIKAKQGYVVKFTAKDDDDGAKWTYHALAHELVDTTKAFLISLNETCRVYWFNTVTDILTSKVFGKEIDKDDVTELVITPKDMPIQEDKIMLEGDGIQRGQVLDCPELKYFQKAVKDYSPQGYKKISTGFMLKINANAKDEGAFWRYFETGKEVVSFMDSLNVSDDFKLYWFDAKTNKLTSRIINRFVSYREVMKLAATSEGVSDVSNKTMLDEDRYDLRVPLNGDIDSVFRKLFINLGGKVLIRRVKSYIDALGSVMKFKYLTAFAKYKQNANIEERGEYYINPALYEEEDEVKEEKAVNAVPVKTTVEQKVYIERVLRSAKRGFVVKMTAEESDEDAKWEFAESPLMVMRVLQAEDAESAQVFYYEKAKDKLVNAIIRMEWSEETIAETLDQLITAEPEKDEEVAVEEQITKTTPNILSSKEYRKIEEDIKGNRPIDMSFLNKYHDITQVLADTKSPFHQMNREQKKQAIKHFELAETADDYERGGEIPVVSEVDGVESVSRHFELPEPSNVEDVKKNVMAILNQYSNRKMGNIKVRIYLSEISPALAQNYLKSRNVKSTQALELDNERLHAIARAGKGKAHGEFLKSEREKKTNFHVDKILRMAEEQGTEMDSKIAERFKK